MIDHISLYGSNFSKLKEFYSKALAPLGYTVMMEMAEWKVIGFGNGRPDLWVMEKTGIGAQHVAFVADSKTIVDSFYKASINAGGKDNGAPGYRKEYTPGYYAAFIHDPDGNNIEVVYHDPNPSA